MNVEMSDTEKQQFLQKRNNGIIVGIICGVMVLLFVIPWEIITGPSFHESIEQTEKYVEKQVLLDSMKQFEIAMKTKNYMDAYVQAGIITATYLQAGDEANYVKWKDIEKKLARKLGMSL